MKPTDEMNLREFCDYSNGRGPCNCRDFPGALANGGDYWCDVAMRRGRQNTDQWIEIMSLTAQVQLMRGLAILGWAAFVLSMMGV